jgi:hypothetical protein
MLHEAQFYRLVSVDRVMMAQLLALTRHGQIITKNHVWKLNDKNFKKSKV